MEITGYYGSVLLELRKAEQELSQQEYFTLVQKLTQRLNLNLQMIQACAKQGPTASR